MSRRDSLALRLARALAAAGLAVLAGCASDASKPTPLEPLTPTIAGSQTWKLSFSGFGPQGAIAAGLRPRPEEGRGGQLPEEARALSPSPVASLRRCWRIGERHMS